MRTPEKNAATKTEGAVKGGVDRYHYKLEKVKKVPAGTG